MVPLPIIISILLLIVCVVLIFIVLGKMRQISQAEEEKKVACN